ncbi:hypothetical protein [Acinetobacter pittii]|uniref:hypothetical protein n=1 Tax=Acinetobacter pittii TaxID=48296 RepID=UPI003261427F
MTVSISERLSPFYEGNGINTRFDFTFRVFDQEDASGISVKHQLDTEFENVDESLYEVSINEDNLGGYVTFHSAPTVGFKFYITGETPVDQLLDITNYDNFYPDEIERSLDKLTAILQEWSHLLGFEEKARKLANVKYDLEAKLREEQIKNELNNSLDDLDKNTSAKLEEAIKNGAVSALAITTVETVDDLESLSKWDGRTVAVTGIGNYKYNATTQSWERDFITDRQIVNVDSISELISLVKWEGRVVKVKSYYGGWAAMYPYLGPCGGGDFVFNFDRLNENDGVTVFNGWERQIKGSKISVHDAGAKGDYNPDTGSGSDDSEAIQRSLKVSYTLGLRTSGQLGDKSFTVNCDGNRNYYLANHVLHPANVTLNGNGCTWYGNNKLNDGVHSAYWVNGTLTDLVPKPLETAHLFRAHIKNILFKNFKYSMNLRGFTFGCSIQDCSSVNCVNHLRSVEHYFLRVLRNKAESCDLGYHFSVFSGMLSFQTVSASNCATGFYFAAAAQAVKINNISVEGTTTTGIYIEGSGNTGGISIQHSYFEGDFGTMVEVSTNTNGSVTIAHNFINIFNGTIAKDSGNCKFIIEDTNDIESCKYNLDVSTSATPVSKTIQAPVLWNGGSAAPNSLKGTSYDKNKYMGDRPDLWICNTHQQLVYQKNTNSGHTQALHNHHFGLTPANYYGNQGEPDTNIIPFCSHIGIDKSEGGTPYLAIDITTSIKINPYMSGLFTFVIYHNNGVKSLFSGRFYGQEVTLDVYKTSGTPNTGVTVVANDVNGILMLELSKLAGAYAPGSYTCTGFVKLI